MDTSIPKRNQITSVLAGIAIAISVTALVLALWPVVADAPWEGKETTILKSVKSKFQNQSQEMKYAYISLIHSLPLATGQLISSAAIG